MIEITQKNGNFKFKIRNPKSRKIHTYFFDEYAQPAALTDDQPQLRRFDVFERVQVVYAYPENSSYPLFEHEHFYFMLVAQGTVSFSVKSTELEQTMRKHVEALMSKNHGVHAAEFEVVSGLVPKSTEKYVFDHQFTEYRFYELSEEDVLSENADADTKNNVWMRVQYRDNEHKRQSVILPFSIQKFEYGMNFSDSVRLQFVDSPCFVKNHCEYYADGDKFSTKYKKNLPAFQFKYFMDYNPNNSDDEDFCIDCHHFDKYEIHSYAEEYGIYRNAA